MRTVALATLGSGALQGSTVAQDGAESDLAKMQGTWKVVSVFEERAASGK